MPSVQLPRPLLEKDGPFSYVYLAVAAVPGVHLRRDQRSYLHLHNFEGLNADAFLTEDWDDYCCYMDTSNAIALMLLTAFQGRPRWPRLWRYVEPILVRLVGSDRLFLHNLNREAQAARDQRHKEHKTPGCYLVYRGTGAMLEPIDLGVARRVTNVGFGIGTIRGEPYRALHRRAFHASVTSLSLAVAGTTASPETHFVGDIVYVQGAEDLVIYSRTLEMGTISVSTSSHLSDSGVGDAQNLIPVLLKDPHIETAIDLFVQSQRKENDNLRCFIAAWSALELLINRLCRTVRADWEKILEFGVLTDWDKDLRAIKPEDYRMRDRFFSVANVLDSSTVKTDVEAFIHANTMRSRFYHRGHILESDLPTRSVQVLFRKYLRLGLSITI